MLLRPKSLRSESLESYMLRLADLYGYTPRQLIERFHIILDEEDQKLSGALPGNLWQLNIYHANTSSSFRVECLEVLAHRDDIKQHRLRSVLIRSVQSACLWLDARVLHCFPRIKPNFSGHRPNTDFLSSGIS